MKKQNIEIEGGELLMQSEEGHYAVIPAKHRQEVMDMVKGGCDDCINNYIQSLPKDSDYAGDGSLLPDWGKVKSTLNPKNWGVNDYSEMDNQSEAFKTARTAGEKEFMYNNKRIAVKIKGENPYNEELYRPSLIPSTYISNKLGQSRDNIVNDKMNIDINNGSLYFARAGETTKGTTILGGDYIEDEPTAYPAYNFKNNIKERYTTHGKKADIDPSTQMYYGIIGKSLKTGLISDFNDDDVVVPIRFGGKYEKTPEISNDDRDFLSRANKARSEHRNNIIKLMNSGIPWIDTKEYTEFLKNNPDKKWAHSAERKRYFDYMEQEVFESYGIDDDYLDRYNSLTDKNSAFYQNGKPVYSSGSDGKIILHSPSSGKQKFLFKHSKDDVIKESQEFLRANPDAEFISMDTGRYNFVLENKGGLSSDDFKEYQAADLNRGNNVGYNIIYDPNYLTKEEMSKASNKGDVNTYRLQKQLIKDGYNLPGSIKNDGDLDGTWGDETRQALLDWQNKNKDK